ncbi:MAG: HNH endonuclease [Methanoregula sp.]|nr:HNH endonuclease [Methanoregula sp.]
MGKRVQWDTHVEELQRLSDDLIERREIYDNIKDRLAGIFGPAKCILGVDARLRAFLEFLFMRSQGPYSPEFLHYSPIIRHIIRRTSPLITNLNESGAHTLGNMVLNGRGHWKFIISDYNELEYVLKFWETCNLTPQTPRMVFDAIISKNEIRYRMERLDPDLLLRLSRIFPLYKDEIIPSGVDPDQLPRPPQEPFKQYYQDIIQDYLAQGMSIDDIIEKENLRAAQTITYRHQFLVYLVKLRHNFLCQICTAGDPVKGIQTDPSYAVEVHHIWSLAEGGEDHSRNMIVTCPHHHKQIHAGLIQLMNGEMITIKKEGRIFFTRSN